MKIKQHAEIKLTPLDRELQKRFVSCRRSGITPMSTCDIAVDMEVKW
jgi:hypothetical protein